MEKISVQRRNTTQKQQIMNTLRALGGHASAGEIFRSLSECGSATGRATVFRVLSSMAEDGMLGRISVPDGDDCYDVTAVPHTHIRCRICGRIADVRLSGNPKLCDFIEDTSGYTVECGYVMFSGICPECVSRTETDKTTNTQNTKETET